VVTEVHAVFRSHIDGSTVELSPERAMEIQQQLGSDVAMVLDHVVALPSAPELLREATERSIRWAARCQAVPGRPDQCLLAIVQGGLDLALRLECVEQLAAMNFPGYAIGGLSVGETPEQMKTVLEATMPAMPRDRPRYLMGVGRPEDLLMAIGLGVDLFDCVMPTRNGRNALAFTDRGTVRLRNLKHQRDTQPLEEDCPCAACRHSRGYLRHLFVAGEMLGPILLTIHNLTYYQRLLAAARAAIAEDRYAQFCEARTRKWSRQ
jgi:queuine tRNA-ribosyltransferase